MVVLAVTVVVLADGEIVSMVVNIMVVLSQIEICTIPCSCPNQGTQPSWCQSPPILRLRGSWPSCPLLLLPSSIQIPLLSLLEASALAATDPSSTHAANTSKFSGAAMMIIDGVSGMHSKCHSLIGWFLPQFRQSSLDCTWLWRVCWIFPTHTNYNA